MARFLGWGNVQDNLASVPELDAVLPVAPPDTALTPVPPDSPHQRIRAVWSDATSFGTSDGFNLAKWRAECQAEINQAASARRRWVKPTAKPGRLSPLPTEFSATFVQGACSGETVIQRGNSAYVAANKKGNDKEKAIWMRQMQTEVSKESRRMAAEWRKEKEKNAKHADGDSEDEVVEDNSSDKEWTDDPARRQRAQQVIARIRKKGAGASKFFNAVDGELAAYRAKRLIAGPVSIDGGANSDDEEAKSNKKLRHRIKHTVTVHLQQRRRHVRKVMKQRAMRKARVMELPDACRQIVRDAFNMYCNTDERDGRIGIFPSGLWKALAFVGMRGPSHRERILVDQVCRWTTVALAKEYNRFEKRLCDMNMKEDHDELEMNLAGHGGGHLSIPPPIEQLELDRTIDFEEFCAEVVNNVRQELSNARQEIHFSEFQNVLRDSESVFLDLEQFRRLALRLGIDDSLVDLAGNDLMAPFNSKAISSTKQPSPETEDGTALDFYSVHKLLMDLVENTHHLLHKRELEIQAKTCLSDDLFWQYEGGLFRLYEHFQMHDLDRCEYLGFSDVKDLLHHLGFQPHRPRESEVLERLLRECDVDGSETFTFDEFLTLIAKVRAHQKAVREARLRREFGRYAKIEQGSHATLAGSEEETFANGSVAAALQQTAQSGTGQERSIDVENLHGLLTAVGLAGRTTTERELVDFTIHTYCENQIVFASFEELCQLIYESLSRDEVAEQYADAQALGISMHRLNRYQAAFDSVRTKDHPCINILDVPKVLERLLSSRLPERTHVDELLEALSPKKGSKAVSFLTFLHLMVALSSGQLSLAKGPPFTLKSVADKKLREILQLFPLTPEYIHDLDAADLPDLVGGFISVRATADLRELPNPVNNIRQLVAYSKKKAAARVETKHTDKFIQQIENAVKSGAYE